MSCSIDSAVIVKEIYECKKVVKLASFSCHYHFLDDPESPVELMELINLFKDKKSDYKEAEEVKIALIVCQRHTSGDIPTCQFYG